MKRQQISQKLLYEKFYIHKIAAVNLSKIHFLKNVKKTCKPNNRDLSKLNWFLNFFSTRSRLIALNQMNKYLNYIE